MPVDREIARIKTRMKQVERRGIGGRDKGRYDKMRVELDGLRSQRAKGNLSYAKDMLLTQQGDLRERERLLRTEVKRKAEKKARI